MAQILDTLWNNWHWTGSLWQWVGVILFIWGVIGLLLDIYGEIVSPKQRYLGDTTFAGDIIFALFMTPTISGLFLYFG